MKYLSRMVFALALAFTISFSGWMAKEAFDKWSFRDLKGTMVESVATILAACEASGQTNCLEKYNGFTFE